MDDHEDWDLELLIQETTNQLEASVQALRDLDRRIEGLARFDAILLGGLSAGLSVWSQIGPGTDGVPFWVLGLLGTGLSATVLSIGLAVWAYLAQAAAVGLHPHELRSVVRTKVDSETRTRQLLDGYILAIATNVVLLDERTKRFRLALLTWIVALVTLSAGALSLFVNAAP